MANKNLKTQNILILVASYFFYSCWDWRFLFLLMFSTFLDYFTGLKMVESGKISQKKIWFWLSIIVNLGFLGIFKYYNFFALSFASFTSLLGFKIHPTLLDIILPVGISFYTFHGLSYVIDIYYDRIKPEKDFVDYALFVSFFPLLVAGPIERATHLLPQIKKPRVFDFEKAKDGMRQILWGLFKKVVIADQCAELVNIIYADEKYTGITLIFGAILFSFQIYGDFSGYSDMALGTARLFGFELLRNFSFPYFSRDIAEFWRRWHISLSSWFKDYLYIPLGGSKGGTWYRVRNTFIIFLVSGFWHGANWTFIVWGFLNALFIMPSILFKTNRNNLDIVAQGRIIPSFRELISVVITFGLSTFAWIFFRAESLPKAIHFIEKMFVNITESNTLKGIITNHSGNRLILYIIFFFTIEWLGRENNYAIQKLGIKWHKSLRWAFYYLILIIIFFARDSKQEFIYFQF
ncbi:MBOAT family O-acyltransferase [Flexibacter flexilis]|nr:MBOAT family O-acyltransferase [Flexibacter flexilis]